MFAYGLVFVNWILSTYVFTYAWSFFVAAEMADLWAAVNMLTIMAIISILQISADHVVVGRPLLTSSETDHIRDVTRDKRCTGLSFDKNFCRPRLMLDETIDILKKLFRVARRRQRKNTHKDMSAIVRTAEEKRHSGWLIRPRMFRSDLGKRSIRTLSDHTWLTISNQQR